MKQLHKGELVLFPSTDVFWLLLSLLFIAEGVSDGDLFIIESV